MALILDLQERAGALAARIFDLLVIDETSRLNLR
jgi:hypothetical protein